MKLNKKRNRDNHKIGQKKTNNNTINLNCPFCSYKTPKTYNYDRHIFINHNKYINNIPNVPKSISSYKNLHEIRDKHMKYSCSSSDTQKMNSRYFISYLISENYERKYFSLLQSIFNKNNRLNKYEEDLGQYYLNSSKIIGNGTFTKTFLGEDKFFKFYVAILKTKLNYKDNIDIEEFILQRVHGKGNFPQLYDTIYDEQYQYFIESLMGPTLKSLFKISDKHFDLYTILNIGIDLVTNLKIFHDLGFVHRDLKPDNLVFGNLCFENYTKRKDIGVIDFGNSKIILNKDGNIKYSYKKTRLYGNKTFASTDALKDRDVSKKDDLISVFYILIYFFFGTLPWIKKNRKDSKFSKDEIIKIRESIKIKEFCKSLPDEFINLIDYIMRIPATEEPDYDNILFVLRSLKVKEERNNKNIRNKFVWINILEDFCNNPEQISKEKRKYIKTLFDKYSINIKEYVKYINSN